MLWLLTQLLFFSTASANTYFHSLVYWIHLTGTAPVLTSEQREGRSHVWTAGSNSPVGSLSGVLAEPPRAEGLLSCDHPMRPRAPEHPQQASTCSTVRGWMKLSKHLEEKSTPTVSNKQWETQSWKIRWSISHPICNLFIIFLHFQGEMLNETTWGHKVSLSFLIKSYLACLFPRDFQFLSHTYTKILYSRSHRGVRWEHQDLLNRLRVN